MLALLALAACDLRNPASPSIHSVPAPAGGEVKHAESVLVGSYSAPNAMPQPGQKTSLVLLESTGITLDPNTYTLIRVTGTLKVLGNPYKPSSVPGQVLGSYTPVQSAQSTGRGATNVWLHRTGTAPGGGERVSYYFRPDVAGRDQILLVRTGHEPLEVWSEREQMPGAARAFGYCFPGFPYCDSEHVVQPDSSVLKNYVWIEDFWVAESHTVTATRITEPLVVNGPTLVAQGGTAAFSARPFEDLRLRDRNGNPADVRWMWYPNDTTGTPPPHSSPRTICSGQPPGTCEYQPTESGRLHVYSYVEGALVQTNKIVRVQQPGTPADSVECEDCNPPEEESTICPQPFLGNVQPALITVAGRNHEFQFHSSLTYPFKRLTGGRSPATYQIGLPTTSKDAWWIAERGTITVWCRGAWITRRHWVGTLTVVDSDLHMVMGPGHPDF